MEPTLKTAFLLTAGTGSRLQPFTKERAKPCLPFLNIPLFAYSYYLTSQAGYQNFLFNLHHLPEQVQSTVTEALPFNKKLHFIDERDQLLGSGGALWNARNELKKHESFLVANGDEVLIPQSPDLLQELRIEFDKRPALACLLVTDHPELLKTLKPVWINRQHEVIGFGMDKPSDDCLPVHYTGYKIFNRRIFDYLPEGESNIFYDVIVDAIAKGEKVTTHQSNQMDWFETGNIHSFIHALKQCLKLLENENSYLINLFKTFGTNWREWVLENREGHYLLRHRDTFVPHNVQWEGVVSLGKDVKVGIKSKLKNVVVESHGVIEDKADLSDTFIFAATTEKK